MSFWENCFKKDFYKTQPNGLTDIMNFRKNDIIRGIRNYDFTPRSVSVSVICPSCKNEVGINDLKEECGIVRCINCVK